MTNKSKSIFASLSLSFMLTVVIFCFLFPVYYLLLASLQDSSEIFRSGMKFFYDREVMSIRNYGLLYNYRNGIYMHWFKNSVLIASFFTVSALFFSSMVGYALGVYNFKLKNTIFTLVLLVMMIPLEILMLPLFTLIVQLKIINSYAGVILPFMVSPIAVFFFRQYASSIAKDFMDAGRIDGCNEFGLYFKIMAPLMKPAFGAMTILLAMQNWNSFVWPLIVMRENIMFTLPIGLSSLINPYGDNYNVMISGAFLAILPVLIVFVTNQKNFISGLTAGGIKG